MSFDCPRNRKKIQFWSVYTIPNTRTSTWYEYGEESKKGKGSAVYLDNIRYIFFIINYFLFLFLTSVLIPMAPILSQPDPLSLK